MTIQGNAASIWTDRATPTSYPRLEQNLHVDVAIVGGGMTGITAALLLARAGKRVAVLEAKTVGEGVTGYTTGHMTAIVDTRYQTIASKFGEDGARLVARSSYAAIDLVEGFVNEFGIDCGFERHTGYLYSEDDKGVTQLRKEVETMQQIGLEGAFTEYVPLPFPTKAGIAFPRQAQIDAFRYVQALAQEAAKAGVQIFENTRATNTQDGEPCSVPTEHGPQVSATDVIMATHAPIRNLLTLQQRIMPYRSYVLAVRAERTPEQVGLYWDAYEPYHYTRAYSAAEPDLLLIGGEDHPTGQQDDTEEPYRRLEQYAKDRFGVKEIVYRWSSQVYEPVDGLPLIGLQPFDKHVYVGTGYSGNGMTFSNIAAMIISDTILGCSNPYAELYDSTRVDLLAAAGGLTAKTANVTVNSISSFFQKDGSDVEEVARGEGKVLQMGIDKVAVYRDDDGAVHAISPYCTHAKCVVNWNNAEKSWDCPCHGGRFSPTGEVIEGPPPRDLSPKEI